MPTDTISATATVQTVAMPQLGESVTEGRLGNWLKAVGDRVEKYEPLVEVETDKVSSEIPSPFAGVLVAILVESDATVPVGTGLCTIEDRASGSGMSEDADAAAGGTGADAEPRGGQASAQDGDSAGSAWVRPRNGEIVDEMDLLRARSSPVVRRIAAEHGVEIAAVSGSGIGGRVTKADILAHVANLAPAGEDEAVAATAPIAPPAPVAAAEAAQPATREPELIPAVPEVESVTPTRAPLALFPGDEVVPVTPMRRSIAAHMVHSERTAPHATTVIEVDMTAVAACRGLHKEVFRAREGIELTFLPFALRAVTLALRDHPRLNAAWDEDRIVHRAAINLGVAVALDDGLIVPVIKHADRLSLVGLAHAVADLAAKARAGTLAPDDVTGGTFTVNNPGVFGSLVSTPILVQPQAAILSTEAVVKRPVVIGDAIAIRSMMNLSLTIDHRVLDGLVAARFLAAVKAWLEGVDPEMALG